MLFADLGVCWFQIRITKGLDEIKCVSSGKWEIEIWPQEPMVRIQYCANTVIYINNVLVIVWQILYVVSLLTQFKILKKVQILHNWNFLKKFHCFNSALQMSIFTVHWIAKPWHCNFFTLPIISNFSMFPGIKIKKSKQL